MIPDLSACPWRSRLGTEVLLTDEFEVTLLHHQFVVWNRGEKLEEVGN